MAGTPPQTQVHQGAGGGTGASPGFDWAKGFFSSLPGVFAQQYPSAYPGQLDPGLSPTMQQIIRQAQGYASQGPSSNLQGIQGTLGSFMSPNFINPQLRTTQGYPDYYGTNPNAPAYGGGTVGQIPGFNPMTGQGGMQSISDRLQAAIASGPGGSGSFGPTPWGGQSVGSGGVGFPPTGIFPTQPSGGTYPLTPLTSSGGGYQPPAQPSMPPMARPGLVSPFTRQGPGS
jgi:hypothetical protein